MLVDVMLKYLETIGHIAKDTAEHAGRTHVNFVDVHTALAELDVGTADLTEFARAVDEMPCARVVPAFPVRRKRTLETPDEHRADPEAERPEYVPAWLPAFPDRATYARTADVARRDTGPRQAHSKRSRHKQSAEDAIVNIARASGAGMVAKGGPVDALTALPSTSVAGNFGASAETGAHDGERVFNGLLASQSLPAEVLDDREAPRELVEAMSGGPSKQ
eukprot:CAMPEP_0119427180 /NCGR_PEP_ID=MMETSP1335-20130426/37738_1 /TAXON_ID=259385 /ORGANISM="Chrysoculter rhomboideus, Strain RCC1486" /LENGTH=219 /DNA_ID=CAMNT_0007452799 /DNA_START=42 /DNA_END=701 /DNA_ORIENTATION=+